MTQIDEILGDNADDSPTMRAFKRGYRKGHFGLASILRRNSVSKWKDVLDEVAPEPEDAVFEDDEYCAKCLSMVDLGSWAGPGDDADGGMMVCERCWSDQEGFKEWFCEQLMLALDNDENYKRLPDGTYRRYEKSKDD